MIKYNIFYLMVLCLFICMQSSFSQNDSFTERYNLNFMPHNKAKSDWLVTPFSSTIIQQDSSQFIHGKYPLCLAQVKFDKSFSFSLKGSIKQKIFLPDIKFDSLTVFINCKSENLQNARLIIAGITNSEDILYSDTLSLLGFKNWNRFSRSIPTHDVAMLYLGIEAEGQKGNTKQRLYIDQIDLKVGEKDINDFPQPTIPLIPSFKNKNIVSLSFSDSGSYRRISTLQNKKIISLGETVHGSETITEATVQLIKNQVETNNCKLILLEIPIEKSFIWNRFIQGDSLFSNEKLAQHLPLTLYSPKALLNLLNWLKQYNKNTNNKVWLFGIDLDITAKEIPIFLFDYINKINEQKHNRLLDSLCIGLYNYQSYPKTLQLLERNKNFEILLGKNEYTILVHTLKTLTTTDISIDKRFEIRDKYMYLNTVFLINLLCPGNEKTVIYAHFDHTNFKSSIFSPLNNSFGCYLQTKYGNNYYSIAILAGEGNFRTNCDDSLYLTKKLENPINRSLENLCMQTNEGYCFIPISTLTPQLTYMRIIGFSYQERQFCVINPSTRMDAIIFIRNSKGFNILQDTPTSIEDLIKFQKKEHDKLFNLYFLKKGIYKYK